MSEEKNNGHDATFDNIITDTMKQVSKTKISALRWKISAFIVVIVCLTAVIVNSHPYEFKVSTDDNTRKAIESMSQAVENQGQKIIDLNVALAVCNERLEKSVKS